MPSFLHRLLLFALPSNWEKARTWSTGAVLLPMLVLQGLLQAGLGLARGLDFQREALELARSYDSKWDPIIVEHDTVRVDGPRLPRWDGEGRLLLVDPDEKVPRNLITEHALIVRRTVIIDTDRREPTQVSQVMALIGEERLHIDSASLERFLTEWKGRLIVGMMLLLIVFGVVGLAITAPLGAFLANQLLMPFRGKEAGLTSDQGFRVALATLSIRPVIELGLSLAGTSVGFCLGLLVWPLVATALGLFALRNLPANAPA
ncbi:MAG: hypothetical protein GQE15_35980 [Archangiaceae bacterium]|nr:hypothetical protein [Archangiaceae bacterium]